MKHYTLLFLLLITSSTLFSQIKGLILDSETNNPIEYVNIWIGDEEIGTTTDKDGLFFFIQDVKNKSLIISSIGYEKKEIQIDTSYVKIYLTPKSYMLEEVAVKPRQGKLIKLGQYRKSEVNEYHSPNSPQILARLFSPISELNDNQFISSLKFESYSKNNATINLRFFNVNNSGEPGEDILNANYIIKVKNGRRSTKVNNLEELGIQIPRNGIFIAFEYLIIKKNEYQFEYYDKELQIRNKAIGYMPGIGIKKSENSANSWVYSMGNWKKKLGRTTEEWKESNLSLDLVIELILTY